MCPYCICVHILRIIHIEVISSTKKYMGCVIPHQSNAVNIPHQTKAGLILKHLKTLQHVSIIIQIIFRELVDSLLTLWSRNFTFKF